MKRAAERFRLRVTSRLQLRQAAQEHVDLEHGTFIRRIRLIGLAEQLRQDVQAKVHQEKPRLDRLALPVQLKLDAALFPRQVESADADARQHLGASLPGRPFQLARHAAHAAHRHFPFAGLVANEVVKETTVLQERLIMRMSEDADLRVRKDQAAHQIVLQIALDRAPSGSSARLRQASRCASSTSKRRRKSSFATSGSSIVSQTFSAKTRDRP